MKIRQGTLTLLPALLTALLLYHAGPAWARPDDPAEDKDLPHIEAVIRRMVASKGTSVRVLPLTTGKYVAIVTGTTRKAAEEAQKTVKQALVDLDIKNIQVVIGEKLREAVWPLTFVRNNLPRPQAYNPAPTNPVTAANERSLSGAQQNGQGGGGQNGGNGAGANGAGTKGAGGQGEPEGQHQTNNASSSGGSAESKTVDPEPQKAERAAQRINAYFGEGTAQAYGHRLLLAGDEDTVRSVRRMLAQAIDIPYPQVRLDVWTIQVNTTSTHGGQKEVAQQKMGEIRDGISLIRSLKQLLVSKVVSRAQTTPRVLDNVRSLTMADLPADLQGLANGKNITTLKALMEATGFNPDPNRPLTMAETLVFLAFLDKTPQPDLGEDQKTIQSLGLELILATNAFVDDGLTRYADLASDSRSIKEHKANMRRLLKRIESVSNGLLRIQNDDKKLVRDTAHQRVFPRLINSYLFSSETASRRGVRDFLLFWYLNGKNVSSETVDIPAGLTMTSSAADALLKNAMSALHEDLDELCTRPLLDWIRDDVQRNNSASTGIDVVGNTSIVVTSRLAAQTVAGAESFFPYRGTGNLIEKLKSSNAGATSFLKGINGNALDIAKLFEPEPVVYNRVAPGISLGVVPTVLPDGGSARLQINLITNVAADQPSDFKSYGPPVDMMRSHTLETDVAVTALDNFELSTFAMEYSRPGEPKWRVPIFEMLPLIGRYFQGPPKHDIKHQESMLMVNVSILPRSLDLAGHWLNDSN